MIGTEQAIGAYIQRELPRGWHWTHLGDLCDRITDGTHQPPPFTRSGVPFLFVRNIVSGRMNFDVQNYVSWETFQELTKRCRPTMGDLLYSAVGSFGVAVVVDTDLPFTFQRHIAHLKPKHGLVDPEYLAYFLNSPEGRTQSDSAALGGAQRTVTLTALAGFQVPLPPLPEQRRIAAILREQMAAVDRARAAAEAQLEAAKALPAAYLRAVFESDEAQEWPLAELGSVLHLRKDVVHPHDHPAGPATFVGLEHIESGSGVRTGCLELEMAELTGRKPRFYQGDIMYGYLRPYLNKVWVAEFDGLCSVDQYVYSVRRDLANAQFIAWYMRSSLYLERAPIDTTPGQLPRIRTEEVASVPINLPPLPDQQRIAATLREQMAGVQRARTALEEQLEAINQLPAALLQQAFSGEL